MSLVAYGSSDESSDEEVKPEENGAQNNTNDVVENTSNNTKNSLNHMSLPVPKNHEIPMDVEEERNVCGENVIHNKILNLGALPKPKIFQNVQCIPEDDDIPLFPPKQNIAVEKPTKKDKIPAKISIPSLSEFVDVDEELEKSKNKPRASKMGTGLFAVLPLPKKETITKKSNLIPHVLTKSQPSKDSSATKVPSKSIVKVDRTGDEKILPAMDYESNSEDEDDDGGNKDFFSLSKPNRLPEVSESLSRNILTSIGESVKIVPARDEDLEMRIVDGKINDAPAEVTVNTKLVSTVMNLPRDEILMKNKAEVGPKLPVPEQEYNVDAEGNVAFDDKAIEYLCGKRGVKRKNRVIEEANIIEINGEDIKPDEREWLVKALTEESVQRPVSMQGAGPSSQSKKKHQITYLAHQAKAMEVELKNTWSQNRMAKKQTQSKYGF